MSRLIFVGHRGTKAYEPENTLRSFRRAFELGANAVECDIRKTKDNQIVVIHDRTLRRTTNGRGWVHKKLLAQIRTLDAGQGEKVPTLEELVHSIDPRYKIFVEFKVKRGLEEGATKIFGHRRNLIAISFYPKVLERIKTLSPQVKTGLLYKKKVRNTKNFLLLCKRLEVKWIFLKHNRVKPAFIIEAHKHGFKVLAWVINRTKKLQKFINMGLDGVASDKPDLFQEIRTKN